MTGVIPTHVAEAGIQTARGIGQREGLATAATVAAMTVAGLWVWDHRSEIVAGLRELFQRPEPQPQPTLVYQRWDGAYVMSDGTLRDAVGNVLGHA